MTGGGEGLGKRLPMQYAYATGDRGSEHLYESLVTPDNYLDVDKPIVLN